MIPDPMQPKRIVLIDAPPGKSEKAISAGVLIAAVAAFALMAPYARVPLGRIDAFIPAYESALSICDLLTAVLLFGQFARSGMKSLLILACAYLFNVLMIVPHALSFPGVFGPHGIVGGGTQTTAWLYCFWHGGFALLVFAYAVMADRDGRVSRVRDISAGIVMGVILTAVTALVLTLFATMGQDMLPAIMDGADYSMLVSKGISPAICLVSLAAVVLLWRRRNASTLDLWLFVVMGAWLCDVGLSAIVGSSRYDLGWYGGRTFGLLAASFLLVVLLTELNRLYGGLAEALDVAEERNVQLQNSREQLAHAQRLEAMGQLTGGVAHDFNNLLMVVTSSMDIILRSPGNAQKVEKFARAALDACSRGQKMTQQLLTFARRQSATPETVDPNRVIAGLEDLLQRAIGPSIQIVTDLGSATDPILVDKVQFESAILNLVVNARDAMPDGGNVIIRTENVVIDRSEAGGAGAGRYVKVTVKDFGSGMPDDVKTRAFDPFFTTKEVGSGSGLGLSQVYGFAKSVGGHVEIDSRLGLGTTVTLILPKSTEPLRTERASVPLPLRQARGTETVLAVEDDPSVLELAVMALEDLGYKVLTAINAGDALKILKGDLEIDLLFSDVIMPGGMNGAQLAVEARRIRPDLKILLTSGYTAEALAKEHGMPDDLEVLPKPYRHEDLAHKLRLVARS
jgi:signal transduction histidine kinase/CheY-like chemotaxis protein